MGLKFREGFNFKVNIYDLLIVTRNTSFFLSRNVFSPCLCAMKGYCGFHIQNINGFTFLIQSFVGSGCRNVPALAPGSLGDIAKKESVHIPRQRRQG
jgi:hypothetical protein